MAFASVFFELETEVGASRALGLEHIELKPTVEWIFAGRISASGMDGDRRLVYRKG